MESKDKKVSVPKWNPNYQYLRKVTLESAIRTCRHVDRETIREHWEKANKK